jgi:hypothetical protein
VTVFTNMLIRKTLWQKGEPIFTISDIHQRLLWSQRDEVSWKCSTHWLLQIYVRNCCDLNQPVVNRRWYHNGSYSVAGIAIRYELDGFVRTRVGPTFYSPVQTGPGAHKMGTQTSSLELKQPGLGVDQPILSSTEVKESRGSIPPLPICTPNMLQGDFLLYKGLGIWLHFSARCGVNCWVPLNSLNAELSPICHLLTLLRAHPILHFSRTRVKNGASTGVP